MLAYGDETYLYGLDRLGYSKADAMYNFLPDAIGRGAQRSIPERSEWEKVRQVIKTTGENTGLTLAKSYDPYGNVIYSNGADTSYGYTGEWTESTGLMDYNTDHSFPYFSNNPIVK